jgi:hypothetical protein
MHPFESALHARLRGEQLAGEAEQARRCPPVAPSPPVPVRQRAVALRQAVGYRLVEAGLRLVVAGPPARGSP